ncbi:tyrosine-type recombinase/integrase [Desulfobaculum senezii]
MKGCRPLTEDEIRRAFSSFSGRLAVRNRCLFVLGVTAGFRVSEMLSLHVRDVVAQKRVRRSVRVARRHMKGRHESRTVYLAREARVAILEQIRALGWPSPDTPLFLSQSGRGAISRSQAYRVLIHAFEASGISENLGTHTLRKTFANRLYDYMLEQVAAGKAVDPFTEVSLALGHKDPASTRHYLSFRDERRRAAIQFMGGIFDGEDADGAAGRRAA